MGLFEHFPYTNFQDLNLNTLLQNMTALLEKMKVLQQEVGGYEARIRSLEIYVDKLNRGDFSDSFLQSLYAWLEDHAPEIFYDAVKKVWFGLTDSGYFAAYVPDSWNDVQFNTTGYDIFLDQQPEYGHLVLSSNGGR